MTNCDNHPGNILVFMKDKEYNKEDLWMGRADYHIKYTDLAGVISNNDLNSYFCQNKQFTNFNIKAIQDGISSDENSVILGINILALMSQHLICNKE